MTTSIFNSLMIAHARIGDGWTRWRYNGHGVSFLCENVRLSPDGRMGRMTMDKMSLPAAILEQFSRYYGDVGNLNHLYLQAVEWQRSDDGTRTLMPREGSASELHLADTLLTSVQQRNEDYFADDDTLMMVVGSLEWQFRMRGEFNHSPMNMIYEVQGSYGTRWLEFVDQGDLIYLVKEGLFARVQCPLLPAEDDRDAFRRLILDRYTRDHHRIDTQIWWTDAAGRGIDGKPIITPVKGYLRDNGRQLVYASTDEDDTILELPTIERHPRRIKVRPSTGEDHETT